MRINYAFTFITAALCSVSLLSSCSDDDLADVANDVSGGALDDSVVPSDPTGHTFTITTDAGNVTKLDFTSSTSARLTLTGDDTTHEIETTYTPEGKVYADRTERATATLYIPAGLIHTGNDSYNQGVVIVTIEFHNYYDTATVFHVQLSESDTEHTDVINTWVFDNFQADGSTGKLAISW